MYVSFPTCMQLHVIDRLYHELCCCVSLQSSGVQISDLSYTDIKGSSATPVAVKFNCSGTNPCSGIKLRNIRLRYRHQRPAQAKCQNAGGSASGEVTPPSCF